MTAPPPSGDRAFPAALREALFAAVLVHDEVDLAADLPPVIDFGYDAGQLARCFELSREMWRDGVDRRGLARLVMRLGLGRADPVRQRAFRHVRARCKHLRCCLAAFDGRHAYPPAFHRLIIKMGRLQDALADRRRGDMLGQSVLLRLLLTLPPWRGVLREIRGYRPCTTASFRAYMVAETAALQRGLATSGITAKAFHELRKIVSRWVAVYDTLEVLYPTDDHIRIARYVGSINGLMGALHDRLVRRRAAGTQEYYCETFALPADIRDRLRLLATRFAATP